MEKTPQKVAYLSRNSVASEIFHLLPNRLPTAQKTEFMFQNVAYRATVYRTGTMIYIFIHIFDCVQTVRDTDSPNQLLYSGG